LGSKIQRLDEVGIAAVRQLVGEIVLAVDAFGQHLADEGFRIGHVFEAMRLQRVGIEPAVGHEIVDRFDRADLRKIIVGLALDV